MLTLFTVSFVVLASNVLFLYLCVHKAREIHKLILKIYNLTKDDPTAQQINKTVKKWELVLVRLIKLLQKVHIIVLALLIITLWFNLEFALWGCFITEAVMGVSEILVLIINYRNKIRYQQTNFSQLLEHRFHLQIQLLIRRLFVLMALLNNLLYYYFM